MVWRARYDSVDRPAKHAGDTQGIVRLTLETGRGFYTHVLWQPIP